MTRPSPAPIQRDVQELRSILLGLPWVRREDERTPQMKTKWETCPECDGHGIVTSTFTGEPDDCRKCHGGKVVVAVRDKRGHFVAQDVDCHAPGYTPGLSKERMK